MSDVRASAVSPASPAVDGARGHRVEGAGSPGPLGRWEPSRRATLVITALLCVLAVLSVFGPQEAQIYREPDALAVGLAVLAVLPLAWWRSHPVAAAVVSVTAALTGPGLGYATTAGTLCAVAAVAAVAYAGQRRAALLIMAVALTGSIVISLRINALAGAPYTFESLAMSLMVIALPVVFVVTLRERHLQEVRLREQTAALVERGDRDAREAAAHERVMITREVHDIVGHHLSAIRVQASAGRHLSDPAHVQDAFAAIAGLASDALQQTRQALDRTREGDEHAPMGEGATVGLAGLPALLEAVRATGANVRCTVEGAPRAYPPAVDDAAYRIVQESLTNVLRHASQRSAQVHVHHGPGSLELCVTDDGAPGPGPAAQGWGLRGMRERAILLGGTVQAGPRDDGPGWRVAAHLPAPPAPS